MNAVEVKKMKENIIVSFLFCFFLFVPFERLFALKREQKVFRKGWTNDALHFFMNYFVVEAGFVAVVLPVAFLLRSLLPPDLQAAILAQPAWRQFAEALLVGELFHYLSHRAAHQITFLWRFHAIHHSVEEMDWLAAVRLHPFDRLFTKTATIIPVYALGFSKETFGLFLVFVGLHALFIHSNVRFRFGFLRYVIATPQNHHWHHAVEPEARNKNMGGLLPIFDIMFGTFYVPKGKVPAQYGLDDPVPAGYLGQLAYPLRRQRNVPEAQLQSSS